MVKPSLVNPVISREVQEGDLKVTAQGIRICPITGSYMRFVQVKSNMNRTVTILRYVSGSSKLYDTNTVEKSLIEFDKQIASAREKYFSGRMFS